MPSETAPPTILVVDDDRLTRDILADVLQGEGRILLARDGPSALNILARTDVHLILLDVSMAGMSGYEVLRRIRATEALTDVPVIFITSMSEETDEELGFRLGAADYVQKPIRPAILRARVRTHLKLELQRRELARLATQDGLTGLSNRRAFDIALDRALALCRRGETGLSLGLFDVDHFKLFNDRYGHGTGDAALCQVARVLKGCVRRPSDVAARIGGEEFALLLPGRTDLAQIMERARETLAAEAIPHDTSPTAPFLTLSGGGIVLPAGSETDAAALLAQADAQLYRAKAEGRNKVVVPDPAAPSP